MSNGDYFYRFFYKCDDTTVEMSFDAALDMGELARKLQDFLKACSWKEKQIEEYIKIED